MFLQQKLNCHDIPKSLLLKNSTSIVQLLAFCSLATFSSSYSSPKSKWLGLFLARSMCAIGEKLSLFFFLLSVEKRKNIMVVT